MYRFPKTPMKLAIWKRNIRRDDREPTKFFRICSCHFVDGSKLKGPTIFSWNKAKRFLFKSPVKQTRRKREKTQQQQVLPEHEPAAQEVVVPVEGDTVPIEEDTVPVEEDTVPAQDIVQPQSVEDFRLLIATQASQINLLLKENEDLKKRPTKLDMLLLQHEKEELEKKVKDRQRFSFHDIKDDDDTRVRHYTGLPNKDTFEACKLKNLNTTMDLGDIFKISRGTVTNIFLTWLHALHQALTPKLFGKIPSRFKNKESLPSSFKNFSNCRIVIDCTEVTTACPESMYKSNKMFSQYKKRITLKGLVGVAPNGTITHVSSLYPGSTSDKAIFADCGIIEQLEAGNSILADKGFLISSLLPDGVELNIPPFKDVQQFTSAQVARHISIAKARIHVERANERIKNFLILNYIPEYYVSFSSLIFQVCCALTCFQTALIADV
ncbi:THAP domain-containing protein 11 [Frankliniella fusca]|uniref:THAP domain-containing protein 11 n=1 Tax=Frankliniella fusca TaxID=407009 RepID=A0AAE1H1Y6_9NEOP|nr:THAP domain-containing protein 11 [Frankliniella fusca]